MRLTCAEIDVLLGLINDVDWEGHFQDDSERVWDIAEKVKLKLQAQYAMLRQKGHKRAYVDSPD